MPGQAESYRQRLVRAYSLALWLTVVLILGIFSGTIYLASTASSGPEIMNLAGRQRMLTQRILAFGHIALSATTQEVQEASGAKITAAAMRMESDRAELLLRVRHSRAALAGLFAREDAETRLALVSREIDEYISFSRAVAYTPITVDPVERARMEEQLENLAEILLPKLEQAVSNYQNESERVTQSIRLGQGIALLAVLVLLWLEVRFIFRPMVSDVVAKTELAESVMTDFAQQTERTEEINKRLMDEAATNEQSKRELSRLNAYLLGLVGVEGVSIVATDADGVIQVFNPGAERLLGYASDEVVGLATPEMFHDASEYEARLRELGEHEALGISAVTWLADRDGREMREWTYIAKDGTRKAVALSVSPLHDGQGKRTGHIFVGVDISALKSTQSALEASETRFKAMADASHDAMILVDDHGSVLFWSKQAEKLLGFSEDEALGVDLHSLITPEHLRDSAHEGMARFAQTGTGPLIGNVLVFDALRKDGTTFPVERAVNAFQHEGRWYAVGSLRDVSERRRIERELQLSRERLELALAGGELGLWDWNTVTDEVHTNVQWCRMLGYEPEELPKTFKELMPLVHPEDAPKVERAFAAHFSGDKPTYHTVIRMRSKDGDWVWILSTGKIMERDEAGAPLRVVGTHLDITPQKNSEQLLREYSQLFDLVQEMARLGAWSVDVESGLLEWTREVFRIHGMEEGVAPTVQEALEFFVPEDRPYIKAAIEQAMSTGAPYDLELQVNRVDGERIWVRAMGRAQFDQGRLIRIYGLLQDIDDRKRAGERMKELTDRLEQALIGSGSGLWDWDVDTGEVLFDRQWMELQGYEEGELPGTLETWERTVHPEDMPAIQVKLEEALSPDFKGVYEVEYRAKCKDGSWMWVVARGRVVARGHDGSPRRMVGIIQDVSERKADEIRMRQLSERLEQALVGSESGLWDWNVVTGDVYLDPLWERIMGYDPGELAPRVETWEQTIHPEDQPEVMARLNKSLTPHSDVLYEVLYRGRMKSGEWRWTLSRGRVVERDAKGGALRMIGVIQDASQRVALEQELRDAKERAEEADRAKSDFLARMSHEIRTPMNAVLGLAHLTLKTDLSAKQRDYVQKLSTSAHHLLGIINDILDFSKIEAGKLVIEHTDFDLEESFRNLLDIVSVMAGEKGLEINLDVAPDVPVRLVGDPLRLGQVLINLCNNAVKFTDQGEIVISTSVAGREEDGTARLRFAVRDTGIGMSQEQAARLFQPFSQADESTTRRFGGTGLGLAISRRLVELMGGAIELSSEPGKGSEFFFTLPFGIGRERDGHFSCIRLSGLRALVADDSTSARKTAARYLEGFCIEVDTAGDGASALDMLAQNEPGYALALLDWRMPGLDGLEVIRAARGLELSVQPKIILMSGHARGEIADRAAAAGADAFLAKPFNQSMLFDTVMEIFKADSGRLRETMPAKALEIDLRRLRDMRVLLAEDNAINQQVAQEILEQAGIKVDIANNGREAVDMARGGAYDAVLMDIQMPVMDGLTAARTLRTIPGLENLPVIAMTAHALSGDRERSLAAGMNGHVTKPVDPNELFEELLRYALPGEDASFQAVAPPPQPDPAPEEFDVPGLNAKDALVRLGGNAKLLRRLLTDFARDYTDAETTLRGMLEAGQRDEAARLAHTIKGVAANLGLARIQAAAIALDTVFKAGGEPGAEGLAELAAALAEAAEGIRSLAAPAESAREAPSAQAADPAAVFAALDRLDPLLRASSMDADAVAEEVMGLLRGGPHDELAGELDRAVGGFDFDAALAVSQRIRGSLREDES